MDLERIREKPDKQQCSSCSFAVVNYVGGGLLPFVLVISFVGAFISVHSVIR